MTPTVILTRMQYADDGTFGVLRVTNRFTCATLEPPWQGNQRNVSCVPVGRYALGPATHHISTPDPTDDYQVYEILNVPNRSAIHLHIGNKLEDTLGCPLLGRGFGTLANGVRGVIHSRVAFEQFMDVMQYIPLPSISIVNFDGNETRGHL